MTFTLLAFDPARGDIGLATASRWPAVGGVVPYIRPGVGAVASQSMAQAALAESILDALAAGADPEGAAQASLPGFEPDIRQLLVMRAGDGRGFVHSGTRCAAAVGACRADGILAAGNFLADSAIPEVMIAAFRAARGPMPRRLLAALEAGECRGGDRRGREAAALRVLDGRYPDQPRLPVDLRVDSDPDPLARLAVLLDRLEAVGPAMPTRAARPSHPEPGDPS